MRTVLRESAAETQQRPSTIHGPRKGTIISQLR